MLPLQTWHWNETNYLSPFFVSSCSPSPPTSSAYDFLLAIVPFGIRVTRDAYRRSTELYHLSLQPSDTVARLNDPPSESWAQKDARYNAAMISDHGRFLVELTERMAIAEERVITVEDRHQAFAQETRACFDDVKRSFIEVRLMSDDVNRSIASYQLEATWYSLGILSSGASTNRTLPRDVVTPPPVVVIHPPIILVNRTTPTKGSEYIAEDCENKHTYRVRRIDFPRFSDVDIASCYINVGTILRSTVLPTKQSLRSLW